MDDIRLFLIRQPRDYVIAHGIQKVEHGPHSWTHKYIAHWTGSDWEDAEQPNAYVWEHKKYAEEYVTENKQLLADKLRDYNRS